MNTLIRTIEVIGIIAFALDSVYNNKYNTHGGGS
jgi:hypothetical protein